MTNDITRRESAELSTDINVITAEINAYQRVAGEAIFEIGRRLHSVKYNPKEYGLPEGKDKHGNTIVARGYWGEWLESVNIHERQSQRMIKIFERFSKATPVSDLPKSFSVLYELTSFTDDELTQEYELPSGEKKKPVDMSRRQIEELKQQLKETEQQAEAERKERERLEVENEKLTNREPEVITEYIEREPSEPYNRMLDEPYSVDRGNAFYELMNEVDDIYKRYAHLKDGVKELRGIAEYDDDLVLKYRKASDFWEMLGEIFNQGNGSIIDAEIIEIN